MYFVYVLKSKTAGKIYIGHTQNVSLRIEQHNRGSSKATKMLKDWELIYSEPFLTRTLAISREKFFKTGRGKQVFKFKNVLKD